MERRQKYPNTKTFRYFNANPKGRITADCSIRAISKATGLDYNDVVMGLAKVQCETGYEPTMGKGLEIYMESIGWEKQSQPKKASGKKYTGEEFCKYLNKNLDGWYGEGIVANIGGHHMVAIMPTDNLDKQENWKVFDIWDSTDGCIGNYGTKKKSIHLTRN